MVDPAARDALARRLARNYRLATTLLLRAALRATAIQTVSLQGRHPAFLLLGYGSCALIYNGLCFGHYNFPRAESLSGLLSDMSDLPREADRYRSCLQESLLGYQSQFSNHTSLWAAIDGWLGLHPNVAEGMLADERDFGTSEFETSPNLSKKAVPPQPGLPSISAVSRQLDAMGGDWRVWSRWITDRWAGRGFNNSHEARVFTSVSGHDWTKPEIVNRAIAEELGWPPPDPSIDPEAVGGQEPLSLNFLTNADGKIDLDAFAGVSALRNDGLSRALHQELLDLIADLERACGASNLAKPLARVVKRFGESLGTSPAAVSPWLAVARGNAIRIELEVDERRRASVDSDMPPLPEGIAGSLKHVAQAWNVYVANDTMLEAVDAQLAGPTEVALVEQGNPQLHKLVAQAKQQELASEGAAEALLETADTASRVGQPNRRAIAFYFGAMRNFIREALRTALYKVKAIAGWAIGASSILIAGGRAIAWLHTNADFLREFLSGYTPLLSLLERILELTKRLP